MGHLSDVIFDLVVPAGFVCVLACLTMRARRGAGTAPGARASLIALAASGFLVVFGYSVVLAVLYLVSPWTAHTYNTAASAFRAFALYELPGMVAAIVLFLATVRLLGARAGDVIRSWSGPSPVRSRAIIVVAGICVLTMVGFGFWVALVAPNSSPEHALGAHPQPVEALFGVLSAAVAAVSEELVVLAVPAMLLRAAGVRTSVIVGVLLAARVSFHLYYGWGALGVLIWASLFLWLFLRWGLLWPQILSHFVFDSLVGANLSGVTGLTLLATYAVLLVGSLVVVVPAVRRRRVLRRAFQSWLADHPHQLMVWQRRARELAGEETVTVVAAMKSTRPAVTRPGRDGNHEIRVGADAYRLSEAAMDGLLAHEVAHVHLGDVTQAAANLTGRPTRLLAVSLAIAGAAAFLTAEITRSAAAFVLAAILYPASLAVITVVAWPRARRHRDAEYAADARAVQLAGAEPVRGLLQALDEQVDPLAQAITGRGIASHPSPRRRLARLEHRPAAT